MEEEEREAAEEPGDKKKEEREQQEGTSEGRRKQEVKSSEVVGINARADAHDHIRAKLLQAKTIKGRANLQKMSARIPKIAENANVYHNVTGIFNVRITSCT